MFEDESASVGKSILENHTHSFTVIVKYTSVSAFTHSLDGKSEKKNHRKDNPETIKKENKEIIKREQRYREKT